MPKSRKNADVRRGTKSKGVKKSAATSIPAVIAAEPKQDSGARRRFSLRRTRKKPAKTPGRVPSVWVISRKALDLLWSYRTTFLGVTVIFAALDLFLVRGFTGATDFGPIKELFSGEYSGGVGEITASTVLFTVLITASGINVTEAAATYQSFLIVITSLAIVWVLRQAMSGEKVRVRDGFYKGMYPLIPVLLVLLVIVLQLIPFIIGAGLYSLVLTSGVAVNVTQTIAWSLLFFAGLFISLFWLASSIFAAYIATLPDMTPMKALRSARDLVSYRRLNVLRKLLFLPLALIVVSAVIMIPILWFITPAAPWIFFLLSTFGLVITHAYIYTLYRELLV